MCNTHCVVVDGLDDMVHEVMAAGAAWATQARWSATQRKFLWFCSMRGEKEAVPTSAVLLMRYCAWLVRWGLSHGTILVHIDGVRVLNANFGHEHPWKRCEYVARRFKNGLLQLTGGERQTKLPLRAHIICRMVWAVQRCWLGDRLVAVVVVAYHMAIRIGHLVPGNKMAVHLLRRKHVVLQRVNGLVVRAQVTLPSTKTSRLPIVRWVHRVKGAHERLCALDWLVWLMGCSTSTGGEVPLVPLAASGVNAAKPWYRNGFSKQLKEVLVRVGENPAQYSGVSLRKGCLTDLTMAGCSPLAVARQATHKSMNSQMAYVRADEELLAQNGKQLAHMLAGHSTGGARNTAGSSTSVKNELSTQGSQNTAGVLKTENYNIPQQGTERRQTFSELISDESE